MSGCRLRTRSPESRTSSIQSGPFTTHSAALTSVLSRPSARRPSATTAWSTDPVRIAAVRRTRAVHRRGGWARARRRIPARSVRLRHPTGREPGVRRAELPDGRRKAVPRQGEDPHPVVGARMRRWQQERGLREVGPPGERGQLPVAEAVGIDYHGEAGCRGSVAVRTHRVERIVGSPPHPAGRPAAVQRFSVSARCGRGARSGRRGSREPPRRRTGPWNRRWPDDQGPDQRAEGGLRHGHRDVHDPEVRPLWSGSGSTCVASA